MLWRQLGSESVSYLRMFLAGLPSWEQVLGTLLERRSKSVLCYASYGNDILNLSSKVFKTNFIRSIAAFRGLSVHVIPHTTMSWSDQGFCKHLWLMYVFRHLRIYGVFCFILSKSKHSSRLFKGNIIALPSFNWSFWLSFYEKNRPANYFSFGSQVSLAAIKSSALSRAKLLFRCLKVTLR